VSTFYLAALGKTLIPLLDLKFLLYGVAIGDAGRLQDGELFLRGGNAAVDCLQADKLRLGVLAQATHRLVHTVDGDSLISGHREVLVLKKIPAALSSRGEVEPFKFVPGTKGRVLRPVTDRRASTKSKPPGYCAWRWAEPVPAGTQAQRLWGLDPVPQNVSGLNERNLAKSKLL